MAKNVRIKVESEIQSSILKYLRSLKGCWVTKIVTANERGVPDIICCYKGKFIALEVKAKSGELTPIQAVQILKIHVAGGRACIVRSVEDVKEVMKGVNGSRRC